MKGSARTWGVIAVASLIGMAVGAGAVWFSVQGRIDSLESATARLEADLREARADLAKKATPPSLSTTQTNPPASREFTASVAPKGTTREFALIKSISTADMTLVADYGQFLTGKEAAQAAAAAGGESPPPNDFYIVNENPKLRTLGVISKNIEVKLATNDDGAVPERYSSSLGELADQIAKYPERNTYRWYWLTVKDGVVFRIDEQYLP